MSHEHTCAPGLINMRHMLSANSADFIIDTRDGPIYTHKFLMDKYFKTVADLNTSICVINTETTPSYSIFVPFPRQAIVDALVRVYSEFSTDCAGIHGKIDYEHLLDVYRAIDYLCYVDFDKIAGGGRELLVMLVYAEHGKLAEECVYLYRNTHTYDASSRFFGFYAKKMHAHKNWLFDVAKCAGKPVQDAVLLCFDVLDKQLDGSNVEHYSWLVQFICSNRVKFAPFFRIQDPSREAQARQVAIGARKLNVASSTLLECIPEQWRDSIKTMMLSFHAV